MHAEHEHKPYRENTRNLTTYPRTLKVWKWLHLRLGAQQSEQLACSPHLQEMSTRCCRLNKDLNEETTSCVEYHARIHRAKCNFV